MSNSLSLSLFEKTDQTHDRLVQGFTFLQTRKHDIVMVKS